MIFWELVGNDVCGSTPTSMTEPDVFRKDILELWKKLDTLVPKGSHMVVTGLVNGEFLYNCLKDREVILIIYHLYFFNKFNNILLYIASYGSNLSLIL